MAVASDGETAKQLLNSRPFDLMITAAMLPRFHGFNLALAVSQDHPGMKIIIISAIYKGSEYRHQAITQYRANDFFEKPLDKEKFKKRVLELLNVSADDLLPASKAATTQIPVFDTAKIPAPKFDDDEANKLSSADIFGDIIQKIEQVPAFEIDLGDDAKAAAESQRRAAPPPIRPRPCCRKRSRSPQPPASKKDRSRQNRRPDPARQHPAPSPGNPEARHPQPEHQRQPGRPAPGGQQAKPRKTRCARSRTTSPARFEDTLSGLGLAAEACRAAPQAPAPPAVTPPPASSPRQPKPDVKAATPAPRPEEKAEPRPAAAGSRQRSWSRKRRRSLEDEIIELGEESLREDRQPAAPAAGQEEVVAARRRRPRKKPRPRTIPTRWGTTSCSG